MKKLKLILGGSLLAVVSYLTIAADHIDAPAVSGGTSDITDFYAFQNPTSDAIAFVANVKGLISPANTASSSFDENVMVEFNIDTDSDSVEDLVIQAIPRNGKMYFFGPFAPSTTGLNSTVNTNEAIANVDITAYNQTAQIYSDNGIKAFAGPRDDPFFMDFSQYGEIIAGNATSFNNPGTDTFAGSNVMSIVFEVPKTMIGSTGTINTWVETKRKQ